MGEVDIINTQGMLELHKARPHPLLAPGSAFNCRNSARIHTPGNHIHTPKHRDLLHSSHKLCTDIWGGHHQDGNSAV